MFTAQSEKRRENNPSSSSSSSFSYIIFLVVVCLRPERDGTHHSKAKISQYMDAWRERKYHTQLDYDTVSFTVMPDRSWEQIVSQFALHSLFVSFDQISLENPLGSADLEVRRAHGVRFRHAVSAEVQLHRQQQELRGRGRPRGR